MRAARKLSGLLSGDFVSGSHWRREPTRDSGFLTRGRGLKRKLEERNTERITKSLIVRKSPCPGRQEVRYHSDSLFSSDNLFFLSVFL